MADLFILRERLKFSAMLMTVVTLLSGLATWYFWKQLEFETDESRFLLSAAITGALILGTAGVFLFYLSARRLVDPSRSITDRIDSLPWWAVKMVGILLLIAAAGFFIYRYADDAQTEFDLLQHHKLRALQERLAANPELTGRAGPKGLTLVQTAYRANDAAAVSLLLERNASAEELAPDGRNPVIESLGNLPMLKVLLANGLSPSVSDTGGIPAVHHAALFDSDEALRLLVEAGAPVDARNRLFRTALMQCIEGDRPARAAQLIGMGADVNVFDQRGDTALHIAVRKRSLESVELLLKSGADPAVFNFIHMTPLHIAAQGGYTELIGPIAEKLDSVDLADEAGLTPFELALSGRQYEAAAALLESGADIDRRETDGTTALHHAVDARDYTAARFLIRAGADAEVSDKNGRTVISICRDKELQGLVELIETAAGPEPVNP